MVEIKSSANGLATVLSNQGLPVQLVCNGARDLLFVSVNKSGKAVNSIESLPATQLRHERCTARNIYAGQRIRYLLDQLLSGPLHLSHEKKQHTSGGHRHADGGHIPETGPVLKLTFDEGRVPVVAPAEPTVTVLPTGLVEWLHHDGVRRKTARPTSQPHHKPGRSHPKDHVKRTQQNS